MPLNRKTSNGDCTIGLWEMRESVAEMENLYQMKESERRAYQTFRSEKRKQEWLATRLLLKAIEGESAEICHRATGRPYLKGAYKCISISHTNGYVGIRLSSYPVAIDIEYKSDRALRLSSKFVTEEERQYISSETPDLSALIIWSAKETLFKLFDAQDIAFDEHITISDLETNMQGGEFWGHVRQSNTQTKVRLKYEIIDDLILVYC